MGSCNSYYNYDPSFEPAIAVAVIFGVLTLVHLTLGIYFRKRYTWTLIMGVAWETISFTMHSLGSRDQQEMAFAVAWQLLFLLAPLWINAFVFMTFARVVHYYMPDQRVWKIKSHVMSKYYVLADITAFVVQAAGGVLLSPGSDQKILDIGVNVYIAGMAVQMFCISTFIALMICFHVRSMRMEREGSTFNQGKRSWKPLLFTLYVVLIMIMIRIVFRLVEFAPGFDEDNEIIREEAYPYALDVGPMILAALCLALFHPGRYLQGPDSDFPRMSRKEKKAMKAEQKAMKRHAKHKNARIEKDDISLPDSQTNLSQQEAGMYNPRYNGQYGDPRYGNYGRSNNYQQGYQQGYR